METTRQQTGWRNRYGSPPWSRWYTVTELVRGELKHNKQVYIRRQQQIDLTKSRSKYETAHWICQFLNKIRHKEVLITRMQLGRCSLNHYMFKMKKHEDRLCRICRVKENIEHYVMHCSQEPPSEIKAWQSNNHTVLTLKELQRWHSENNIKHATKMNL